MRFPPRRLTILIRNDSPPQPALDAENRPTYRDVTITLTDEQLQALEMLDSEAVSTIYFSEKPNSV